MTTIFNSKTHGNSAVWGRFLHKHHTSAKYCFQWKLLIEWVFSLVFYLFVVVRLIMKGFSFFFFPFQFNIFQYKRKCTKRSYYMSLHLQLISFNDGGKWDIARNSYTLCMNGFINFSEFQTREQFFVSREKKNAHINANFKQKSIFIMDST